MPNTTYMNPQPFTIIFTGHSGGGKGTQAEMLMKYLSEKTATPVFHLESGAKFREFITGGSYSAKLSNDIYTSNSLQPEFLSICIWGDLLINNMKGGEHLIFDGVPRRFAEADVLGSAFDFYKRGEVFCVNIEISPETSLKRLRLRGRSDDKTDADIEKRLAWFETEVVPVINYYKTNPRYSYVAVDGEKTPDEVHASILKALGLAA